MKIESTVVYAKNLSAITSGKRLIINCGGTSSSKSYSIVQLLINIAATTKIPILISMVSESFPHLRRGLLRDFKNILGELWDADRWSASISEYNFGHGKIEFFSADDASKLRGGRRDILFINEANNITKESFDELDVRTRRFTIIDFNPVEEFWAMEMQGRPEVEWIHSTYLDAVDVLDKATVDNILSRKDRDPNWWNVYGMGLVGKIEGLVHPNFSQCDSMPEGGKDIYGLDFGYSNDPAALILNRVIGDTIYSDELIYEKGLTNDQLAKRFDSLGIRKGYDIIIADCAEPKSIDEIKLYGYDIRPCLKGPDSVRTGIQRINQYKQVWTKRSLNAIKEQRNYRWEKNKDGKFTDKPIDDFDHCLSARMYAVATPPRKNIIQNIKQESTSDFEIDFLNLSPDSTLYCSEWVSPAMKTVALLALWNSSNRKLHVFHEVAFDTFVPEVVLVSLARAIKQKSNGVFINLSKFEWYGNSEMFSVKHGGRDINHSYRQYNQNVQKNNNYMEFGAIGLLSRLISIKGLVIHNLCQLTARDVSGWYVEEEKPADGFLFARCLSNLVSVLVETGKWKKEEKPRVGYSVENTNYYLKKKAFVEKYEVGGSPVIPAVGDKDAWMQ